MIGQLINKFENLENNTLADFNTLFRTKIEGEKTEEVVIGAPLSGNRRAVTVGKKRHMIVLECKELSDRELVNVKRWQVLKDGKAYETFDGNLEAARCVGVSPSTAFRMSKNGKVYNGFTVKCFLEKVTVAERNRLKYPPKNLIQKRAYIAKKDGIEIWFRNLTDTRHFFATSNRLVSKAINEGTDLKGHKLYKRVL